MARLEQRINEAIASVYAKRRVRAITRGDAEREALYKRYPELRRLDEAARDAGLDMLHASLPLDREAREKAERETDRCYRERDAFLLRNGIDADYREPRFECPRCRDTGFVNGTTWCECRKHLFQDYLTHFMPIPMKEEAVFDRFDLSLFSEHPGSDGVSPRDQMATMRQVADLYVRHFDEIEDRNLLFSGIAGTGKSFLMQCIGHRLIRDGVQVVYITAPLLFDAMKERTRLRQSYAPDEKKYDENELLTDAILDADLLLFDDLGSELTAKWSADSHVSDFLTVLDRRDHAGLHTIIATNLSREDIRNKYDERIFSRLMSDYLFYRFPDDDIRLKRRYESEC